MDKQTSNLFFGHNVPEMYALMRDKQTGDHDIFKDLELANEKLGFSEPDLYYKEESFNSGETNLCFILGHSGSGKSMMARTLEGDDIDHIELDDLLLTRDHFTMDELKDYSDMMYSFFSGEGAKYYIGLEERNRIPKEEYEDKVFVDFVHFAMDYAKNHKDKKYIIDGIWIYLYFDDPSVFEDYAVFIKGTSFLKSKIRTMNREMHRDRETVRDRKQMFEREVRNYFLDEEKIDNFRSFFSDSPETVFREETGEAVQKDKEKDMNKIHTDKAPAAVGPYSQAIVTGGMVYTSGQIALDPATGQICGDTIEDQADRVMKNLVAVLEASGTKPEHAVKTTCFLADMKDFAAFNEVYARYFTEEPARSCVGVASLPKGALCEVEVVAVI